MQMTEATAAINKAADGVTITRDQLECWAGRTLTDEEVAALGDCIPNSSIPDAIAVIAEGLAVYPRKETKRRSTRARNGEEG